jgi:hypothetical protein
MKIKATDKSKRVVKGFPFFRAVSPKTIRINMVRILMIFITRTLS